ncbi:MAG: hypothetical protein ABIS06_13120 [Vicinamibacterales bacterium]
MAPLRRRRDPACVDQQRKRRIGVRPVWVALGASVLLAGDLIEAIEPPGPLVPGAACRTNIAVVDEAGMEDSQMRIVIREVDRIWAREGVGFSWVHDTPSGEGALTVIIQQGTLNKGGAPLAGWRHVLGSIPVSGGQVLSRISVSLGTVRSLLADALVQGRPLSQRPVRLRQELEAQALGRVVAHEIGHYRLGSYGHTATGLMRAVFSTEELIDRAMSRFWLGGTPAPRGCT